jgi:hypothetical protein
MIKQVWLCGGCYEEFEDESVAEDCCPPMERFKCAFCDETWYSETQALKHFTPAGECPKFDEAAKAKQRREELEAAGQGALFQV